LFGAGGEPQRANTFVSVIQEHNQQMEIRSRLLIEFEILHVRQSLGNSVNVLTAVLQLEIISER
jgi:hypothetical protein